MKHEYTDLCQVLDMLYWGKVVKYLPRLNVTQNSVSAPQKMLYSGGRALLWLSLIIAFFSQQSGNEKAVQETTKIFSTRSWGPWQRTLHIWALLLHNMEQGRANRVTRGGWQQPGGHCPELTCGTQPLPGPWHSPAPRAAAESPKGSTSLLHHLPFAGNQGTWETSYFMFSNL